MLHHQSLIRISQRHLRPLQVSLASKGLYMGMLIALTRSTVTQIWIHNAMRAPTSQKQTTAKQTYNHQSLTKILLMVKYILV